MDIKAAKPLLEKSKYWRGVINEWKNSGLSQAVFCKQKNLVHSGFSTCPFVY